MRKIILAILLFGISLPVWAMECPVDKPMKKNGNCYPCEERDNLFSGEECNKCPKFRKFEDGLCIFTKSPYPDLPLFHIQEYTVVCPECIEECESCVPELISRTVFSSCDDNEIVPANKEDCALCPNRKYENGKCLLNECPKGYFRLDRGDCLRCGTEYSYTVEEESCDNCPEREYKNGKCMLKTCPMYVPIKLSDGNCVSCSVAIGKKITESDCAKCRDMDYIEGKCVQKCKKNQFKTLDGYCLECDDPRLEETTLEECQKCSNRLWYGKCQLLDPPKHKNQSQNLNESNRRRRR